MYKVYPILYRVQSEYKVDTTLEYAVAQKDIQLHLFHPMNSTVLTDYHATAYQNDIKPRNCVSIMQLRIPTLWQGNAMQNNVISVHGFYTLRVLILLSRQ